MLQDQNKEMTVIIRPCSVADHASVWAILKPVFQAGDTYTVDPDISCASAVQLWTGGDHTAFVAEQNGQVLGTYYIMPNQKGGGRHVCNCGFATTTTARGQGVASAMLNHALKQAGSNGYSAMQFNFVVSTNRAAIALWQRHGFDIVGQLPKAFNHPTQGLVDAYVMFRAL